jgi:hypothetical protein
MIAKTADGGRGDPAVMPLVFSFWFMVASYVIHVLDESLLGGSFVEKVRQHWWPQYNWRMFFWFNTGYFIVMIASVILYDLFGGAFLILPLAWLIERTCNGFWHLWWALRYREYSPGLVTSVLMWMNAYFVVRYRPASEVLPPSVLWPAAAIGLVFTAFLVLYIPVVKGGVLKRIQSQ